MSWINAPNALHCTALHCIALHCTALHCTQSPLACSASARCPVIYQSQSLLLLSVGLTPFNLARPQLFKTFLAVLWPLFHVPTKQLSVKETNFQFKGEVEVVMEMEIQPLCFNIKCHFK